MGPCSSHGCSKQWNVHQILKTQTIVITFCCVWERTSHILVCKMTQIMALLISWSESQNETKPIGQTKANIEKKCEVWNKMSLVILRKVDVCNLLGEVSLTSNIFLGWGVSPLLPIMFYHIFLEFSHYAHTGEIHGAILNWWYKFLSKWYFKSVCNLVTSQDCFL